MQAVEANFDGLVGPTHNYSGLSYGNVASEQNQQAASNPKEAAKQGLKKMKALYDLGMVQGVLAPQERPDIHTLRRLGFTGSDPAVLKEAAKHAPRVLANCCSASSMWTANAATVSPSADTSDGRVHFTPANLTNKFHRSIEHHTTGRILNAIFDNEQHFAHHAALPGADHFGDEGAANHTRFCENYNDAGVEFFVFGKYAFDTSKPAPTKYPARQTYEASMAIARLHQLNPSKVVYAQQNPQVIDHGVFHNDVIAVGNQNTLFFHEEAFLSKQQVKEDITAAFGDSPFHFIEVPTNAVSVADAVSSYLFNSQLIALPRGGMAIIVPEECRENTTVYHYLQKLIESSNPIKEVKFFDLKQSMCNGGGPACLRLRVVLTEVEQAEINQACLMSDHLFSQLDTWIEKHYRDRLTEADLADPKLLVESRAALDELTDILELGSVYPFQL
ncbi:N-succinylarginine dihydrolase [Spartinivicinus poritis]|uniref:N-succinylarginine dihydrolase n=1 Tax=Spartinivicinus poritis TaxID=2994640 RepID=A0ABT5UBV5_9GAMM|nr:N-succinylarginine dihydrolase [Spartinivicinus sp. A2-2]MDE1463868.1 N-succinylarginine dihydrolase [Spartinivicinus sp. A2-2]